MRDMKLILGSVLIAVIVGAIGGWTVQGWRMTKQIAQLTGTMDRMILEHTEALARANAEALTRYAELERKKQEAVDEANRIAQRNARAAANARAESERLLRNQIAAADWRQRLMDTPLIPEPSMELGRDDIPTLPAKPQ